MAAASFIPSAIPPDMSHVVNVSSLGTLGIGIVTLIVLGLAMLTLVPAGASRRRRANCNPAKCATGSYLKGVWPVFTELPCMGNF